MLPLVKLMLAARDGVTRIFVRRLVCHFVPSVLGVERSTAQTRTPRGFRIAGLVRLDARTVPAALQKRDDLMTGRGVRQADRPATAGARDGEAVEWVPPRGKRAPRRGNFFRFGSARRT
jgi:hypothetical protein